MQKWKPAKPKANAQRIRENNEIDSFNSSWAKTLLSLVAVSNIREETFLTQHQMNEDSAK